MNRLKSVGNKTINFYLSEIINIEKIIVLCRFINFKGKNSIN